MLALEPTTPTHLFAIVLLSILLLRGWQQSAGALLLLAIWVTTQVSTPSVTVASVLPATLTAALLITLVPIAIVSMKQRAESSAASSQNQTDQQPLAQRVQTHTAELTHLLERQQQLAQALQTSQQREKTLAQLHSSIIRTVSHEFRTPLAKLSISLDLLTKHRDKISAEKSTRITQQAYDAIHEITALIDNMLVLEVCDEQDFAPNKRVQSFDEFIDTQQIALTQLASRETRISLTNHVSDIWYLHTDEQFVIAILQELVQNALKFSAEQSVVSIDVSRDLSHLWFDISDHGIGIDRDEQPQIGELFFRGSNVTAERGLGIGYYIARQRANALGGTLTLISSQLSHGTTMRLALPLAPSGQLSPAEYALIALSKNDQYKEKTAPTITTS